MDNPLHILVKNRVTVSSVCLLLFIFVIIPSIMAFNLLITPDGPKGDFTPGNLVIIITYLSLLIVWHLGSYYLKKNLLKKRIVTSSDFIDDYEGGFEVLVDANTFGLGKKYFGYEKLKVLFACNAIALGTIMILLTLISLGKFELLTYLAEKNLLIPVGIIIYFFTILASYKTVKRKIKI